MQINIAIIQYDIAWENIQDNLAYLSEQFTQLPKEVDLVVLPEMFATGFSMNVSDISQNMDGEVVSWMKQKAKCHQFAIMGTQAIDDNGIYNRALFVLPNGDLDYYNKRHLFSPGREDHSYSSGTKRKVFNLNGIRILPQICYDLRFPVWSRNKNDYDIAIYMANWPEVRQSVWNTLLIARAMENQSFVVGANRVGVGNNIAYKGGSIIVDFKGQVIADAKESNEEIIVQQIDISPQVIFRNKFDTYADADDFEILL